MQSSHPLQKISVCELQIEVLEWRLAQHHASSDPARGFVAIQYPDESLRHILHRIRGDCLVPRVLGFAQPLAGLTIVQRIDTGRETGELRIDILDLGQGGRPGRPMIVVFAEMQSKLFAAGCSLSQDLV